MANINETTVGIGELFGIVKAITANIKESKEPVSIMIFGDPGIGKTTVGYQLAQYMEMRAVLFECPSLYAPDIRGYLLPPKDGSKKAEFSDSPLIPDEPVVLILDEITSSQHDVQTALHSIVLNHAVGEKRLAPGSIVIATGNLADSTNTYFQLSPPMRDRAYIFKVREDINSWLQYAAASGIHPAVSSFIKANPMLLHTYRPELIDTDTVTKNFTTPRSWERVSNLLKRNNVPPTFNQLPGEIYMAMIGTVGVEPSVKFKAWVENFKDLPTPAEVMKLDKKEIQKLPPDYKVLVVNYVVEQFRQKFLAIEYGGGQRQASIDKVVKELADVASKFEKEYAAGMISTILNFRERYKGTDHYTKFPKKERIMRVKELAEIYQSTTVTSAVKEAAASKE